jgi:hypothetical protein
VTANELKKYLSGCFEASPFLAQQAIPFLLQKLASSITNTKVFQTNNNIQFVL